MTVWVLAPTRFPEIAPTEQIGFVGYVDTADVTNETIRQPHVTAGNPGCGKMGDGLRVHPSATRRQPGRARADGPAARRPHLAANVLVRHLGGAGHRLLGHRAVVDDRRTGRPAYPGHRWLPLADLVVSAQARGALERGLAPAVHRLRRADRHRLWRRRGAAVPPAVRRAADAG